ncbi:dihydroorotate dehydrogenase (quinone) [Kocuria sp. WRN011]|uniref:quinone-dependent dihydroorotate dehydrogenase n=1 Tax=Kocuria TaxID=57493 RepID=UPI000BAEFF39|nr:MULTISPECIES: quinone-dependent dihydroorotate dehydrogenase [Kocuria]PBB08105.1 dihydroorotate dehydrogenase (quinone) [Kocuria sp. WRN011]PZP34034.1 MAG: quinone-dependent dihydroorotate dehydrogenase [Kocuria rhizophila]
MRLYPTFFKVAFSWMDAELAHTLGFAGIKAVHRSGLGSVLNKVTRPDPGSAVEVMGLRFPSAFGLAAGFDKGATGTHALTDLGFGHVEIGTVTGQPQPGNPKPRLFRLIKDRAVINRMGFNNDGAAAVAPRVAAALQSLSEQALKTGLERPIVGVNIGKTKVVDLENAVGDYVTSTRALAPYADYLVVNVSSPNTPGLRQLQELDSLRPLLTAVREESSAVTGRHVPLLVKIAPDLADADVQAVAELALDLGLDGIVATNTTIARDGLGLRSTEDEVAACGAGGLSGRTVRRRSLDVLKMLHQHAGDRLTLISVGGVTTPEDVIERLDAGADLVQGYTAFLYEGPFWAARINRGLKKAARRVRG